MKRDSLNVNKIFSPAQKSSIQRNSKNSGTSTKNTNFLDSRMMNSPYMQQIANRNLSQINNTAIDNGKRELSYISSIVYLLKKIVWNQV